MIDAEIVKLLEETTARLSEHFECVQILVSWNEAGNTRFISRGAGNWYARQGMAHEFINADLAHEAAQHIASELKKEDEE